MRTRTLLLSVAILAWPLSAANFSGKWLVTRESTGGRGPGTIVITLNQVGADLTGSITPPRGNSTGSPANVEVFGGKVDGDTISFYIWTGLDRPVKNLYQGKLNGDAIVFTVTVDSAGQTGANAPRSFQASAKRIP
jgi:hypothetical protein